MEWDRLIRLVWWNGPFACREAVVGTKSKTDLWSGHRNNNNAAQHWYVCSRDTGFRGTWPTRNETHYGDKENETKTTIKWPPRLLFHFYFFLTSFSLKGDLLDDEKRPRPERPHNAMKMKMIRSSRHTQQFLRLKVNVCCM